MCKKPKENKLGNPSEIPLRMEINRDREHHRAEMGNTDLWKPRPSIRTTIHVFGKRISSRSKFFTYSYLPLLAHRGEVVQIAEKLTWSWPWRLTSGYISRSQSRSNHRGVINKSKEERKRKQSPLTKTTCVRQGRTAKLYAKITKIRPELTLLRS